MEGGGAPRSPTWLVYMFGTTEGVVGWRLPPAAALLQRMTGREGHRFLGLVFLSSPRNHSRPATQTYLKRTLITSTTYTRPAIQRKLWRLPIWRGVTMGPTLITVRCNMPGSRDDEPKKAFCGPALRRWRHTPHWRGRRGERGLDVGGERAV